MADPPLEITVVHAGLEYARFPVLVGNFERSGLVGTQTLLDARLGGRLSARAEAELYPGRLGESCFLRSNDEHGYPPGVYVVGLGDPDGLDQDRLAYTVRQALLQRCLPLCDAAKRTDRPILIGLSSLLLGSFHGAGLTVDAAVLGIVDGIRRANAALAGYTARLREPVEVRVAALELIERYADRAERAVRAVRQIPERLGIGAAGSYHEVRLRTDVSRGGLPADVSVDEATDRELRIEVVAGEQRVDGQLPVTISVSGGLARVDRVDHVVPTALVAALASELPDDAPGSTSAASLFNLLVPAELEQRFSFGAPIQLIVDAATANLPWELLSVPRAGVDRGTLANLGGIVRRFAEDGASRQTILRSMRPQALVIGAGRLPGKELPGVTAEAASVARILATHPGFAGVELLSDEHEPLDAADFVNALFGEHRAIHVAGHGHFDPRSNTAAALLGERLQLTADLVSDLRTVPEIVFLNCCQLAGIGAQRIAASLFARAAGDRGQGSGRRRMEHRRRRRAELRRDVLDGDGRRRPVRRSRARGRGNVAATVGGDTTWAAYQCYGESSYRLERTVGQVRAFRPNPVSVFELRRQLDALAVQSSDAGRSEPAALWQRIDELRRSFGEFDKLVHRRPELAGDIDVHRRLAELAASIGWFGAATEAYQRVIACPQESRPTDFERLADVQARFAQQLHPDFPEELAGPDAVGGEHTEADVERLFQEAESYITTALHLGANVVRYGIRRRGAASLGDGDQLVGQTTRTARPGDRLLPRRRRPRPRGSAVARALLSARLPRRDRRAGAAESPAATNEADQAAVLRRTPADRRLRRARRARRSLADPAAARRSGRGGALSARGDRRLPGGVHDQVVGRRARRNAVEPARSTLPGPVDRPARPPDRRVARRAAQLGALAQHRRRRHNGTPCHGRCRRVRRQRWLRN